MKPDKLSNSVRISITTLYDYLRKYDYETIKEYFDTVYGTDDNKRFDFEIGFFVRHDMQQQQKTSIRRFTIYKQTLANRGIR